MKLSRRSALTGLASTAFAASALPKFAAANVEANTGEVTIFSWETYHEDDWIAAYEASSGVKVRVVRAGSADEMYAQVQSGALRADILYFDTGSIPRYQNAGLISPVDVARISGLDNISPAMEWREKTDIGGQIWGVPYNWGTQPLMYNKTAIGGDLDSWDALWDPQFKGKVNLFDDAYTTFPMIALKVGAADPFNLTDEEFKACAAALRDLRPQVGTIARGFDDAKTIYASGDALLGYCQNISIVSNLNELGSDFAYSFPKEGTPTWLDCAVLTPNGNRQEVYDFISAGLALDWQGRFVQTSKNNGVLTLAEAKLAGLSEAEINVTNILDQEGAGFWKSMVVFQPPENIDRRLEIWNAFKAGTL